MNTVGERVGSIVEMVIVEMVDEEATTTYTSLMGGIVWDRLSLAKISCTHAHIRAHSHAHKHARKPFARVHSARSDLLFISFALLYIEFKQPLHTPLCASMSTTIRVVYIYITIY